MSSSSSDPGAAGARTSLAWTRTALGLLGNGVLVLVRHERAFPLGVSLVLAVAFVLAAGLALIHARARRTVVLGPGPAVAPPTIAVTSLGLAVVALGALTVIALAIWT